MIAWCRVIYQIFKGKNISPEIEIPFKMNLHIKLLINNIQIAIKMRTNLLVRIQARIIIKHN